MTITLENKGKKVVLKFEETVCDWFRYTDDNIRVGLDTDRQYSNDAPNYWYTIYDQHTNKVIKESKCYPTREQAIRYLKMSLKKYFF